MTLSLKLLADLHISPKTVVALRLSGYAIERVTDYLPAIATDCQIIALAERLQASILTQDLDFSALIARSGMSAPSVVSLRVRDASPRYVTALLLRLLPAIEKDLEQGAIISVDEAGIRVRLLPVR